MRPLRSWARRRFATRIDASLREIVNAKRRLKLMALLRQADRFEFDTAAEPWGGDGGHQRVIDDRLVLLRRRYQWDGHGDVTFQS